MRQGGLQISIGITKCIGTTSSSPKKRLAKEHFPTECQKLLVLAAGIMSMSFSKINQACISFSLKTRRLNRKGSLQKSICNKRVSAISI